VKGSSGYVANLPATNYSNHDIFAAVNNKNQLVTYTWLDCFRPKVEKKEVVATPKEETKEDIHPITRNIQNKVVISPNPLTNSSTITYSVKDGGDVSMGVYNISGVLVKDIIHDAKIEQGTYTYTLNKDNLQAGMYLVTFTVNGYKSVVKLLVQ
jgi:hypothetical protein